ncbi:HNH endonuclease [Streptomyces rubiginosohelvolus]|uniref:HNH endonuclease n=1 Tax=Streptomyces rubiginosohelvolus TaxID=67362 RepID=UPI00379E3E62
MAGERRLRTGQEAGRRRNRERYQQEKAKRKAYAKAQYWANRDARVLYSRAWRAANRDLRRLQHENRRARKIGNPGSVAISTRDWIRLCRRYAGACAYCGMTPAKLVMDHVVPLSKGGRHGIGNVLPTCATCNGSKSAKLLAEWRARS